MKGWWSACSVIAKVRTLICVVSRKERLSSLERKLSKLKAACSKFYAVLREDQRQQMQLAGNDVRAVLQIVENSVFDWSHRLEQSGNLAGTIKMMFHRSCKALDQHSGLLELLPSSSEYVSLFYGSIKMIVQVRKPLPLRLDAARLNHVTGFSQSSDAGNRATEDPR
jgi:hypothetical protein